MAELAPLAAFSLGVERTRELIVDAIDCFSAPEQLPRRPPGALEPQAYREAVRGGHGDAGGLEATSRWLCDVARTRQRNSSALGALLWACRQWRDVLPEDQRGDLGQRLTLALVRNWGVRVDVPPTLAGCHALARLYGTPLWADANDREWQRVSAEDNSPGAEVAGELEEEADAW